MNKKIRTLIILVAVFIVAATGYVILSNINSAKDDKEEIVRETDAGDIASIVIKRDGAVFTFENDGNGGLAYKEDATFPMNSAYASSLITGVTQVKATRTIANDKSKASEYGLDAPQSTVTVTLAGGKSFNIYIGDQNPVTSYYYMCVDGSDKVYSATSTYAGRFCRTIEDMASLSVTEDDINVSHLRSISVKNGSSAFDLLYKEDNADIFYNDHVFWYVCDAAGEYTASSEKIAKELKDVIEELSFEKCVVYKPTDKQLADFGISSPKEEITLKYLLDDMTQKEIHVKIGKEVEMPISKVESFESTKSEATSKYMYVYNVDANAVYLDKSEDLATLLALNDDSEKSLQVCRSDLAEIDAVTCAAGSEHQITLSHDKMATSGGDRNVVTYVLDGKTLGKSDDRVWQVIYLTDSMAADKFAAKDDAFLSGISGKKPDVTVSYKRNSGKDVTVNFYKYDDNFYLAMANGEGRYLVNRKYVESLAEVINTL